mmetsp:Transcript_8661/g.22404  ORF Transcript_8661/g.22404 Transcript_8661/m.22404 type:complete len:235 (-) Transcript_8661:189-893(-)
MLARWQNVVALALVVVWIRPLHPTLAASHLDNGRVDDKILARVRVPHGVGFGGKGEWGPLEAGLGEPLGRGAQPELIPAAMVGRLLPPGLDDGPSTPHGAGGPREQLAAEVPLLGVSGGVVLPRVELRDRRTPRHAARIVHRGVSRGSPRVEFPKVLVGSVHRVLVRGAVLRVEQDVCVGRLGKVGTLVKVRDPSALSGAGVTTDAAALGEPEGSLARIASGRSIGAPTRVGHD